MSKAPESVARCGHCAVLARMERALRIAGVSWKADHCAKAQKAHADAGHRHATVRS